MCAACFTITPSDALDHLSGYTICNHQINCVLSFPGYLDADILKKAILLSMLSHPVLGCRFIEDPDVPHWELRDDLEHLRFVTLVETDDVDRSVHGFVDLSVDSYRDPQIQALLIRSPSHDTLCLKVNHACCDGGGFKHYLPILASLYTKVSQDPSYRPVVTSLSRRDHAQVLERFTLQQVKDSWEHSGETSPSTIRPFPFSSFDSQRPAFVKACIAPEQSLRVIRYARSKGVTVNDILLAAFYRALFKETGIADSMTASIDISIDMRRYAAKAEALCNLTGFMTPTIEQKIGDSFEKTLNDLSQMIKGFKKHMPGVNLLLLGDVLMSMGFEVYRWWMLRRWEVSQEIKKAKTVFSNIGVIGEEGLRFGPQEAAAAYMIGPAMKAPGSLITITTYKNTITLAIAFYEPAISRTLVERFLDDMVQDIDIHVVKALS